jgi:hypothetical protein
MDQRTGLGVALNEDARGTCFFCDEPGLTDSMPGAMAKVFSGARGAFGRPEPGPEHEVWFTRIAELDDDAMLTLCAGCVESCGLRPMF